MTSTVTNVREDAALIITTKMKKPNVHLVVLQHGLWGCSDNLGFLESQLQLHLSNGCLADEAGNIEVRTLNSRVSEKMLSYDGVDACGERLTTLVKDHLKELAQKGCTVTHLSFIGYSLGGVIARYAVGKLEHEGFFSSGALTPVNFITIATPHIGTWKPPSGLKDSIFNSLVSTISSWSGYHLMYEDKHTWGRPILINLADPCLPFYQGLQRFKKLALLANIHCDQMVSYRTAAICLDDPYADSKTWLGVSASQPATDPSKFPSVRKPLGQPGESEAPEARGGMAGWWVGIIVLLLLPLFILIMTITLAVMSYQGVRHYKSQLHTRPDNSWLLGLADIVPKAADTEDDDARIVLQKVPVKERISLKELPPMTQLELQTWAAERLNQLPWQKVDIDARHMHAHAAIVVRIPSRFQTRDQLQYLFSIMEWS